MNTNKHSRLLNCWYKKSFFCYLLVPFSFLYRFVLSIKTGLYRWGFKKATCFDAPVIVVGNITVGGTGKTPAVIAIVEFLKAQGFKPGVVSRGYGGKAPHYPYSVTAETSPKYAGDEPVLIVRRTQCPVVVDPRRVNAVKKLLADFNCDVVISDDGLQHLAMDRDIEIAVIDANRGIGNGFCLPAGPLREPVSRLKQVDFILEKGKSMRFVPSLMINLSTQVNTPLKAWRAKKVHAVAGIGHPTHFFNTLREIGLDIIEHRFPDHSIYRASDFEFGDDLPVIMTEKDAVKCQGWSSSRWWYLTIEARCNEQFLSELLDLLREKGGQHNAKISRFIKAR